MFSLETVKDALHAVVVEKGEDFVYTGHCSYTEPEEKHDREAEFVPSCIVGQVLAKIDPEYLTELQKDEWDYNQGCGEWMPNSVTINRLDGAFERFDDLTMRFLGTAQSQQDSGIPYGLAEARALKSLEAYSE